MYGVLINPRVLAFSTFCVLIFPIPGLFLRFCTIALLHPAFQHHFLSVIIHTTWRLSPIFRTNSASTRTPIRKQGTPEVLQFLPKGSSTQRASPVLHTCLLLFRDVTFLVCLVFFVHVFQPPMFRVHVCSLDLGFRRES